MRRPIVVPTPHAPPLVARVGGVLALVLGALLACRPALADPPPPAKPLPPPSVKAPNPPPPEPPPPRVLEFPNDTLIERNPPEGASSAVYFYRTNFVKSTDLVAALGILGIAPGEKSPINVKLTPYGPNTLLLEGDPDLIETSLEALAYFDVPVPQVFLEAKVVEITYESNFEFGLDYLWSREKNGPDTLFRGAQGTLDAPSFLQSLLPGAVPFQGTQLLWGFVGTNAMKFGDLDVIIQALQLEGKAEVLSKPSIIATQGIAADLVTQEIVPVTSFERADNNNTTFRSGTIETGVKLNVMPQHIGDSFVTLTVKPEVKGVAGLAATRGGTLAPIQTLRSASTTVTMGDGETLVIGGLYTNSRISEKAKTPLLSDIPLLGQLFTRTRETKAKTELFIIITPRIVRKTADFRVIVPPAELERLEQTKDDDAEPCEPRPFPSLPPLPKPCVTPAPR